MHGAFYPQILWTEFNNTKLVENTIDWDAYLHFSFVRTLVPIYNQRPIHDRKPA
jgi:hypothetical protein